MPRSRSLSARSSPSASAEQSAAAVRTWSVYLLRCADGTYYTGSTTDVDARVAAHNAGRGAKYTSGRKPVTVVYVEACGSKSAALSREYALKRLTRSEKATLIVEPRG